MPPQTFILLVLVKIAEQLAPAQPIGAVTMDCEQAHIGVVVANALQLSHQC